MTMAQTNTLVPHPLSSAMRDFGEFMRQVAPLLGYDPRAADRKGVARYRSHGSLKIDFGRGIFADFESGVAGGVLDFIRHASGEDARIWLERQGLASRVQKYSPLRSREMASRNADAGAEPRELTDEQKASAAHARATFEQAQPIDDVPEVAGYLAARGGLDVSGCKSELRYSPTTGWENELRKCLLVAYRSLDTNVVIGISRILLDEPERWPKTQRKMLGVVRRAAIKLTPIANMLAVAEGFESAVAANMLGYGPAWALGSAGAVKNLPVLSGVERLILIAENDASGASRKATDCCSSRWLRAGRKVSRVWPNQGCSDLNDELISRGKPNGND
jgi:Toprim domain-containing protein